MMNNQSTQLFDMPTMREDDLPDIPEPQAGNLQCPHCRGTLFHEAHFVKFIGGAFHEGAIIGGERVLDHVSYRCTSCNRIYDRM